MKISQAEQPLSAREVSSDPSWRDLYRTGGVAGILMGICYLAAIGIIVTAPPPLNADGATTLQYVASHKALYIVEQVLWLGPGVLAMLVFLALAVALKHLNKSYATIGGLAGIAAWALSLALPTSGGGAPVLVSLGDQYMAATTAAQHTAFATAAEVFIAENNITNAVGILTPVGILILSLVMLKGVFPRSVAYLGILTGALGIVSETLRPIMGVSYTIYGVLLLVWFLVIGWLLYRLGRK